MDELEIQGKKYISSKRASQLTGYAKDYVGQLARGGKIAGTRMGRAWFVEEKALLSYKAAESGPYESTPTPPAAVAEAVQPVTPPKTYIPMSYVTMPASETWTPASYSRETSDLKPKPERGEVDVENFSIPIHQKSVPPLRELETPLRIKVLEARMREMRSPEFHKAPIAEAKIVRRRRKSNHALSFGALTAALALFIFFSAGFFLSSDLRFTPKNGSNTADILLGYEYVRDVFKQYPIFQDGAIALAGFVSTIFNSFSDFLTKGLQFILSLPQLVIQK